MAGDDGADEVDSVAAIFGCARRAPAARAAAAHAFLVSDTLIRETAQRTVQNLRGRIMASYKQAFEHLTQMYQIRNVSAHSSALRVTVAEQLWRHLEWYAGKTLATAVALKAETPLSFMTHVEESLPLAHVELGRHIDVLDWADMAAGDHALNREWCTIVVWTT